MEATDGLNTGVLRMGPGAAPAGPLPAERTIIVTGLGRSGTSMMAALLRSAGLYMGDNVFQATQEDAEFVHVLTTRQPALLPDLIRRRNADRAIWGFKLPGLHAFLPPADVALFRNPRLIVIYRDPLAIALRHAQAEKVEAGKALLDTIGGLRLLTAYVEDAACPALLVSYEKMLAVPDPMIDAILAFCGLTADAATRARMLATIQPNNARYIAAATREFSGTIDDVVDGRLSGWCWEVGSNAPVEVDLLAGDQLVDTVRADLFRPDLLRHGIGDGNHGFQIVLSGRAIPDDAVIRMRVSRRTAELRNGGKPLHAYIRDRPSG